MSEDLSSLGVKRVGDRAWRRLLIQGAADFGFQLDGAQVALFTAYAEELLAWNRRFNLTTITAPADIALKHFVDSLPGAADLGRGWRVLDMGSGGGFPGIPLKIVRPDLTITLVDAVRKKVSFQKQVCRLLGLNAVHCVHARIEDLAGDTDHKGAYDAVLSRALTDLEPLCRLATPLLSDTGRVVAYRGPTGKGGGTNELPPGDEGATNWRMVTRHYRLPYTQAGRSITCCEHCET